MGYVAKFTKGTRTLDLSTGRYDLGDFVPPQTNIAGDYAIGTSANRYGGASKVGEKALPTSYGFSVRIEGNTNAEVRRGRMDINWFLRQAGDENEPVYFEWKPNSDVGFEPLWGQFGANLRVEVLSGSVSPWQNYFVGTTREKCIFVDVNMTINPFALGKKQRVGSAVGGVLEDTIGTFDGRSRGVIVPETVKNQMTNPIFGHSTYNNGWTTGGDLILAEETDPSFVLFGTSSVKLIRYTTGGDGTFTQSIDLDTDATAHVLSFYVKLPDSSTPTESDVKAMYDGTSATTTFESFGDGWYRGHADITSVAGAAATGVRVSDVNHYCYLDGFQVEEKGYETPLAYGDMLGCSWDGTEHASESTRAAPRIRVANADAFAEAEGTIRACIRMNHAYGDIGSDRYVFAVDLGADMTLYYDQSEDDWVFSDGVNSCTSTGEGSFSKGDEIVFHCVYSEAGIFLYKNGSQIATDATFRQRTNANYIYIGSNAASSAKIMATFRGFATFSRRMTAAEVLADYTNIAALTADDQRVEPIPYLWTKDGDDVLDNCTLETYQNYGIVAGIDGDSPCYASMEFDESTSGAALAVWLCNLPYKHVLDIGQLSDESNNVTAHATWLNAEGYLISLSTTSQSSQATPTITADRYAFLRKDVMIATCLIDAGSDLQTRMYTDISEGTVYSDWRNITPDSSTIKGYIEGPIQFPDLPDREIFDIYEISSNPTISSVYKRTTGTANIEIDYAVALVGDIGKVVCSSGRDRLSVFDGQAVKTNSSYGEGNITSYLGRKIEFVPNMINHLSCLIGDDDTAALADYDATITFNYIKIIPRWSIA